DRVDFVKCDVEGHELPVVRGAAALIRTHRPAWLIELSGNPDDPASAAAELGVTLRCAGYETYRFDGQRLRRRVHGDRCLNTFFPRGRAGGSHPFWPGGVPPAHFLRRCAAPAPGVGGGGDPAQRPPAPPGRTAPPLTVRSLNPLGAPRPPVPRPSRSC